MLKLARFEKDVSQNNLKSGGREEGVSRGFKYVNVGIIFVLATCQKTPGPSFIKPLFNWGPFFNKKKGT